ncbi:kinase-like domain-containing protein [Mucor mucedo]|uniref:kinase-like domain-containing protein n=1 Tax=Mucor mucedo TaxID=29922 RepID=UPI00221F89AE|nr:kinase-like domain-containing protein [Mucor mucedo]KAI7864542.1 kinase-like domain-containing protein [Mucor mucedo]
MISFFEEGGFLYLVFTLVGKDLFDQAEYHGGKLSLKSTVLIAKQLVDRIEYLHDKGILHLDLKPENITVGVKDNDRNTSHHDETILSLWIQTPTSIKKKGETHFQSIVQCLEVEFAKILDYARSLSFSQKPDYKFVQQLLDRILQKNSFRDDQIFDCIKKLNLNHRIGQYNKCQAKKRSLEPNDRQQVQHNRKKRRVGKQNKD